MKYEKTEQQDIRDDYVKDSKRRAWQELCQVNYMREVQLPPIYAEIEKIATRLDQIDTEITALDSGIYTKENSEKVKAMKQEKQALTARLTSEEKMRPGLYHMARELNGICITHEATAERYLALAHFAATFEYKEAKVALEGEKITDTHEAAKS